MSHCLACLGLISLLSCPLCDRGQSMIAPEYDRSTADPGPERTMTFISYYNLKGRLVKRDTAWNGRNQKILVLTYRKKSKIIEKTIKELLVIDLPSPSVIDSMNEAYATSDSTHKEHGFFVGKKGAVSRVVEGAEDHLSDTRREARISLDEQGDVPAYDVHTHPQEPLEGHPGEFGSAYPSRGPMADTDSSNFIDRAEANIVLGYEDQELHSLSTGDSNFIGPAAPRKLVRTIGFYNARACIKTIEFARFEDLVTRLNFTAGHAN